MTQRRAAVPRLGAIPRDALWLAALLLLAVIPRLPTLGQPLLEAHPFRQTWTAWTAQLFYERGIDLFRPLVPIFGPPFVLPGEFPLFQALASVVMGLGVPTDPALRATGLATFVLSVVALWLLARDLAGRATAYVAAAIFVTTPLAMVWSRTSMIEYLALGAALAYCWAGLRWRDGRGARWWPIALGLGIVAALVKPPTFVALAIPLVLTRDRVEGASLAAWLRTRLDPRLVALGIIPLAASMAWLAYGDGLKQAQPAAAFLRSSADLWRYYYYGSVEDRIDPKQITFVIDQLALAVGGFSFGFLLVGIVVAARVARASAWAALALAIVLPIEAFWGGYTKHSYYFIAVSAQTAMLTALGVRWAWGLRRGRGWRVLVVALALAGLVGSLARDGEEWSVMYDPSYDPFNVLPAARQIAEVTQPDELALMLGYSYNPSRLYYAQRSGLMVSAENMEAALRSLPRAQYRTLYVNDPWADSIWITRAWRYVGAREQPVYRMSDSPAGVADAPLVATDEATPPGSVLAGGPITIPCDFAGADVPAGRQGTLLELRSGYPVEARLAVGYFSGPVPARRAVWLDGALTPTVAAVRVTCAGAAQLVVERVLDAPLDRR